MSLKALFDDRCGKCRRFIALSSALDFAGRLEPIGLSDPRRAREFGHFDLDALNFEMHVIDPRNRVFRGFYAIRRIALEVPLMWPLAALLFLPGVSAAGIPIYAWIARTRYGPLRPSRCDTGSPCAARLDVADGVDAGPGVDGIKPPNGAGSAVPCREEIVDITS
jgi:predicted DCC family thiol-disulfide oxidoreductase YuxK